MTKSKLLSVCLTCTDLDPQGTTTEANPPAGSCSCDRDSETGNLQQFYHMNFPFQMYDYKYVNLIYINYVGHNFFFSICHTFDESLNCHCTALLPPNMCQPTCNRMIQSNH